MRQYVPLTTSEIPNGLLTLWLSVRGTLRTSAGSSFSLTGSTEADGRDGEIDNLTAGTEAATSQLQADLLHVAAT